MYGVGGLGDLEGFSKCGVQDYSNDNRPLCWIHYSLLSLIISSTFPSINTSNTASSPSPVMGGVVFFSQVKHPLDV